ncbi:MAG: response regulator [Alphaproteobacteria bacterium]|nr:response regulator [Alphaproteobacteria bacterium]
MIRNSLRAILAESPSTERRVMVVDDDPDFSDGLASVLEMHGYSVVLAHDITSAETAATDFQPHMAILDIRLGEDSGIDLLNRLLKTRPQTLCVMVTAYAEADTAIGAIKSGAYDYLRKPLYAEEVLAVLGRCDDTLRLREANEAAEDALKRERRLLFDAIESVADGFALFDSEDRLVLYNNRLMVILDCVSDQLAPGAKFEDLVRSAATRGAVPAAEGRVEEYVRERMERHRQPRGPFEAEIGDGQLLMVEDRVTADGGRVILYSDITERRHVEKALHESETRFGDMVANVPGVVFQLEKSSGTDAAFHYVSPSVATLMGLDPEMVIADPSLWLDMVHPDDRPGFDASLARAAQAMEPWVWEGRMVPASGVAWWCQGAARPKPLDNGGTLWNGIILDVTERKELEEQLLQSQRLKVIGQLSGGVAHDFNNLMLSAVLNVEAAMESGDLSDEVLEALQRTLNSLANAKELTLRLLAFSRQQALNPSATDVNALVSEVFILAQRAIGENIGLDMQLADGLGNAMVDPRQLENALINLVLNARDAMPSGGELNLATHSVELDEADADALDDMHPGSYVMISVSDTGSGMTRDVAERAFEPFFTTKEVGAGSGLGLSMVYGFLKQSGGHIALDSAPGKGTTVTLYLPRTAARGDRQDRRTAREREHMPRGNETVLVVEDEPDVRTIVVSLLTKLGYKVLDARDGHEALERLDEVDGVDLLFTDIVLPGGMTGQDVADAVAMRRPGAKFLFTSGYAAGAMDDGGRVADGAELLTKPYPMKVLANRIREVLDGEDE